jgi:outer membrane protein assembly factor BamE (lipoprotein component of BamABCDE complex)
MSRICRVLSIMVIVGTAMGCVLLQDTESRYLRDAQDRATTDQVRHVLGEPSQARRTSSGETVWFYEVREEEPGSQNTWASVGSWCDTYELTFDAQGVLRRWVHKSYVHGGELMPIQCDAGVQKAAL